MDDVLLTISSAARSIVVTTERLKEWMDNNEWIVLGDQSATVNWDEVNVTGHLAAKNGAVLVTPKGLAFLRSELAPDCEHVGSEFPF